MPFRVSGQTAGVVALGARLGALAYTADDRALLEAIVGNACPYLQRVELLHTLRATADDLARKVRAMAVVNEIALAVTAHPSARRLHRVLLERIAAALDAAEGALALEQDGGLAIVAHHHAAPAGAAETGRGRVPHRGTHPRGDGGGRADLPGRAAAAGDELSTPVRFGTGASGAVWVRRDPAAGPFGADDRALLALFANEAALVLENSRLFEGFLRQQQEQFRLRGMLEQTLPPAVAERLIAGETRPVVAGTRVPLTVLMVDMRRSTEWTNAVELEAMVPLLNRYLGRMSDVLFGYEGTVDRFEGDAVQAFFGAPEAHPDDPVRAVRAAAAMQRAFDALRPEWARRGALPATSRPLGIGIGIATGEAVVGNIGSARRLQHTVSGVTAILAAPLARARAGAIHLDEATWNAVGGPLGLAGRARLRRPRYLRAKGFAALVPVYCLCASDVPEAPGALGAPGTGRAE